MAKTAVITGGASGIGKQTAIRLAQLAENIVVVDRNIDGAEELIENLQKAGNGAKAISLDVTDFEAVKKAAAEIKRIRLNRYSCKLCRNQKRRSSGNDEGRGL